MIRKTTKKRARRPRVPLEALKKLGSRPISTRKGKKGYDRERQKARAKEAAEEDEDV